MKNILAGLLVFISIMAAGCGGSSGGSGSGDGTTEQYPRFSSGNNEIVSFTFPGSKNSGLSGDVTGVIKDSVITLNVPNKTVVISLVAEFTINGGTVKVNEILQDSGVTPNNFTNSLEYTVTAENGDKRVYSVVVVKAPSNEKSITAFSLNGIAGTIDESAGTISVELPAKTSCASLKAIFETAGKKVTVGDTIQTSGVTENDFAPTVKYTVTAEDLSVKEYNVTVSLLKDTAKSMTSFGFKKSDNPSLGVDITGVFSGNTITVELPYGTTSFLLKAFFETTGFSVRVNEVVQKTSETENNFSGDVEYVVTAENGDVNPYVVKVTVAKSDAKAITQYKLDGETAVIDESAKTITSSFASSKNLTGLVASYAMTGIKITVDGVEQYSNVTTNNFTSPVVYRVTADNGTFADYTVKAKKSEEITGIWNFEYGSDGSYTIAGADTVDGIMGSALYFNKGDYVLVPDSDSLTLADSGTIEAVIKADSHQPFAGVVHKGVKKDFSDESYSLQFWGDNNGTDGTLRFSVFNSSGAYAYVESSTKLELSTWYYVVATWDASEIKIYVNGICERTIANSVGKVRDSAGGLVIGAQLPVVYSSSWSNLVFNGTIDMVKISSVALSGLKISEKYKELPFASSSSLTAYIIGKESNNYINIGLILGIIMLVLIGFSVYNNKRA